MPMWQRQCLYIKLLEAQVTSLSEKVNEGINTWQLKFEGFIMQEFLVVFEK